MMAYGIVVHGGVGSSVRLTGACRRICGRAFAMLEKGAPALDAAVEAVRLLENDGRFNAGSGSVLRLDGKTMEMDASVMDSEGRLGMVMAVRDVPNPVLLARAVTETPHVALAGTGAALFAAAVGLARPVPVSQRSLRRYAKMRAAIQKKKPQRRDGRWKNSDIERLWNFEVPYSTVFLHDTVGAVALDRHGAFASAASTGGASPMMLGRVGDTPMVGSGFYAGPHGAVAATGIGEEIVRRLLSSEVYDMLGDGAGAEAACDHAVALFPKSVPAGIIAITREGGAISANRRMAAWSIIKER
jgi:L-asparaginase/beta-aspartyl-peptidase (threonine type)